MLRTSIISVFLIAVFFGTAPAAVTVPAGRNLLAYTQGQSYERLFQDHLMPGTCGIVLERSRCSSDLQTVQAFRGPDATDRFMEQWISTGDLSLWKNDWNGMYVPDDKWSQDPGFAWWYTAGIASIAAKLPQNSATTEYAASIADVLSKHAGSAPAEFAPNLQPKPGAFASLGALQSLLAQAIPVAPFPAPSFGSGDAADARLGTYLSTVQQLIDNPLALSRPESRAFALLVLNQVRRRQADYGQNISINDIQDYLSGEIPSDPKAIDSRLRTPLGNIAPDTHWPDGPRKAFYLGYFSAQVAYNAAVLKDIAADKQFRGWIASLPPYNGMPLNAVAAVKRLALIQPGNWTDINSAATSATLAIASP